MVQKWLVPPWVLLAVPPVQPYGRGLGGFSYESSLVVVAIVLAKMELRHDRLDTHKHISIHITMRYMCKRICPATMTTREEKPKEHHVSALVNAVV